MSFNKYAQYPTESGLIHVKDQFNTHLFTMWTDNIRSRIEYVDKQHSTGCPSNWSDHRKEVAQGAGRLVYEVISMPGADQSLLRQLAESIDSFSASQLIRQ